MSIRFSRVLASLLYLIIWLGVVALQVFAIGFLGYHIVTLNFAGIGIGFVIFMFALGFTYLMGGMNSIPGIFWRFRKNVETRVIQLHDKNVYAMQIRLLGRWFWLDVEYADWPYIVFFPDFSLGDFFVTKGTIKQYETHFEHYLQDCFVTKSETESVRRTSYVHGEKQ